MRGTGAEVLRRNGPYLFSAKPGRAKLPVRVSRTVSVASFAGASRAVGVQSPSRKLPCRLVAVMMMTAMRRCDLLLAVDFGVSDTHLPPSIFMTLATAKFD